MRPSSNSNLTARNWFHSLPSQRFHALLTLFPKSFSPFPHGTCLLSVSSRYLALEEHYLPFSTPNPKCATLRRHPVRMELPTKTGLSPFLVLFSKKTEGKPPLFWFLILQAGNNIGEFLLESRPHFRDSFFILFHNLLREFLDLNIPFNVSNFSSFTHCPISGKLLSL